MKQCEDYEIEISALLDGESDPKMALHLVQHVASCSSCSAFVREMESTQAAIDSIQLVPDPEPVVELQQRRRLHLSVVPRWAWGLAAGWIVAVGVWFGTAATPARRMANDFRDGELVIHLEADKGRMTDERFVALMSELLRADRRYQSQMYTVLDGIRQDEAPAESGFLNTMSESTHTDESGWSEHNQLSTQVLK